MPSVIKKQAAGYFAIALLVVFADRVTKIVIESMLPLGGSIAILPGLNIVYIENAGAAFGFLSSAGGWQRWFFIAVGFMMIVLLLVWLLQVRERLCLSLALCLILGGAIGNLWDRMVRGSVIDFIDVYWQNWHWPAFNVADSAICVGGVLLLWDMYREIRLGGSGHKPNVQR